MGPRKGMRRPLTVLPRSWSWRPCWPPARPRRPGDVARPSPAHRPGADRRAPAGEGTANAPFGTLRELSGEAHCGGLLPRNQTAEGRSCPDRDAINEDGHDRADHEQVRQGD